MNNKEMDNKTSYVFDEMMDYDWMRTYSCIYTRPCIQGYGRSWIFLASSRYEYQGVCGVVGRGYPGR